MTPDELRGAVAIVGMAGRFSGSVQPPDFDRFDAGFFGFNPREAEILDPQQRVFLEVCWEALEDAGYDPAAARQVVGVFGGGATSTYLLFNLLSNAGLLAAMDPLQLLVGNAADSLATRVSYKLNLKGPSFTVQAGESTPGLAVHVARQSLLNGECDLALAGWVSIDARTMTGEAAVLVLKRADEALRDRDNVQALVLDSEADHADVRLVLEEAPEVPATRSDRERYALPVSARSEEALERACQRLADWLEDRPELELADVEYTLTVGRRVFEHRRVVECGTREEAVEALRAGSAGILPAANPKEAGRMPALPAKRVSLPTYPFERRRYWIQSGIEPKPEVSSHSRPALFTPYEPPRDGREEKVCRIWREVLGVDPVGVHDDFFQLGGHSLLAPQILGRVREDLAVDFPLQHLFSFPTPAELAEAIGFLEAQTGETAETAPSIPVSPLRAAGGPYPLSFSQERLWFIDRLDPGNPIYNEPRAAHISGALDVAALERSLFELMRRQEALRTTFLEVDDEPAQVVHPVELRLPRIDLSALPEARRRAEAGRLTREEARRPFDLAAGPVLRTTLLRLDAREHVVLFNVHHIASDGWSLDLLVGEVATLYRAFALGLPSPLPEPPVQYADFAHWQRRWLQGETLAAQLAYWREELAGATTVLELPTDRPRPAVQSFRGDVTSLALPARLVRGLDELGRREGATRFMTLLAGFQALLHRLSGQPDVLVGSPIANRTRPEIEGLVGFFVNLLVLRGRFREETGFRALLEQVRDTALRAYAHQDLPFEKLVEGLRPERDLSRTPVFQVLFVLQNAPLDEVELPGLSLSARPVEAGVSRFDLTLAVSEEGEAGAPPGGLVLQLEHNTDLFDAPTAARFLRALRETLAAAAADPERRLRDLPLLAPVDRRQVLSEWNDTRCEMPAGTVLERFHDWAERTPEAPALLFGGQAVTYAELAERGRRLARHLRSLGIGPEQVSATSATSGTSATSAITALCAERSPEMIAGVLGTLEAGGAYLPLDPDYPADRLSFLLADSGAKVLLTTAELAARIAPLASKDTLVVLLDGAIPEVEIPLPAPDPGRLAYVIYTSGSTGRPKGVLVEHRGLPGLVESSRRWLDVRPGDRILQFASLSFDVSVWETWEALATGAALVLAPREELLPGPGLIELLRRQEITHLHMPPSALAALPAAELPLLRCVCVAGEACPPELARRWGAGRRFVNAYGPTEITVIATLEVASADKLTIGRPLLNVQAYVLDPRLEPVPVGAPGELCIGGMGMTRGYHDRPELTAERFVPDPFSAEPGRRLYRTGDLTRFLPDGRVEYLGRLDRQVKVRGFRIELGEIEAALARHPAVVEARVVVREEEPGDRRLVAFVVPREGDPTAALRAALRETLPEYMVPSRFVLLPALPTTPNGKVDVARLAAMEIGSAPAAPPRGGLEGVEALIAGAWRDVLKVDRVERDDNFFDLGGHSLLLPKLHARLRETLGRSLTLADLFRHPTVRSLARFLSPAVASAPAAPAAVPATRLRAGWTGGRIAIVGLSCRFPGARDAGELWRNLRDGVESIRRLDAGDLLALGADPALLDDPAWVPAVAMPDDFDRFDARFFGMSVRDAEILDPQQRMFLEAAWAALEDAGCDPDATGGRDDRIGVFAGAGVSVYLMRNLLSQAEARSLDPLQTMIANMSDTLTARVSYKLNLRGPSYSVQSACSTSLVAVHHARLSLLAGDCDVALAGGVSLPLTQLAGYRHQEGSIASPDGHCRAFDAGARGTVFGGGAGVVVLKRLEDALADGDAIRAVLLGSAVNNDGALKVGFTAPSAAGQEEVLRDALAAAGVPPESIGYVEAHGTGTEVGDPIEVQALSRVLAGARPVALGSIKTNFGHLDTAAGVAGLIKTVLALEHRQIPPSLHYETPNPAIDFASSPVYVNRTLAEWRSDGPRRAGVSSFGIGGTNAHAVLEEAPAAEASPAAPSSKPRHLLVLSARTAAALEAATRNLANHLRSHPDLNAADVAWTLQTGRKAFRHRRAVVCAGVEDAAEALESLDPARVSTGDAGEERTVAFLLSGQGSQYPGMGREIYDAEPVFRREIDRCATLLGIDLRAAMFGDDPEALGRTEIAQPALFAFEYALAALWREWGIVPGALLGHSLGEYVAACLGGAMSLEDALALVAARGRLMGGLPAGAMLAVALPEREVPDLLADGLSLAAVNEPSRCVVSGPVAPIEALERRLAADGASARRLHTSHAFHSAMMEPVLAAFEAEVRKVRLSAPALPWVSNVTGTWIKAAEATDPAYWVRHLRQPVRFADGVAELLRTPRQVLLEVGPGTALATLARRSGAEVLASTRHPGSAGSDLEVLLAAAGRLWAGGQAVDWRRVQGDERRRRVPLPTYPFERQRYWIEAGIEAADPHPPAPSPGTGEGETRLLPWEGGGAPLPGRLDSGGAGEGTGVRATLATMAAIWRDLLGVTPNGPHDDFFELGGDSLVGIQLTAALRRTFEVDLPLRAIFEVPRLADMAARVEALLAASAQDEAPAISPSGLDRGPLSYSQERLWFLDRLEPDSPLYNVPMALRLTGRLDPAALERSLAEIVRRHGALRTTFEEEAGEPVQVVAPVLELRLPVVDLRGLPDTAREAEAGRLATAEARRPFDLRRGPLLRARLLRLEDGAWILLINLHHIVSDGWSMGVLFEESAALYSAFATGRPSPLAGLPVQYLDFAVWQRRWLRGAALDGLLAWWREALAGAPTLLELPADRPRPASQTWAGACEPVALPAGLSAALGGLVRAEGATRFMGLLAAFQALLHRYTGQEDILVGTPVANRSRPEMEGLIGFFVNTLVLRGRPAGRLSFRELLGRACAASLDAFARQDVPFDMLVDALGADRSLAHNPLFQVALVLQNTPLNPVELPGVSFARADLRTGLSMFDLTLGLWDVEDRIEGTLDYSTALFDAATARRLLGHLAVLLEAAVADPSLPIGELPLLTDAERGQLREWSAASSEPGGDALLHEVFAAQAGRTPDAVAVVCEDLSLTYAELDRRAAALARRLRDLGVGPEVPVGLCLERSAEMVVAVLGTLMAGGAYVPLDPAYPEERLRYLFEDSRMAVLVTSRGALDRTGRFEGPQVVLLEDLEAGEGPRPEPSGLTPDHPAYVIYTSGSTGRPKGVVVTHRHVARLFQATDAWFGFGPEDVWSLFHSYAFDFSVWEIWGALLYGGRLVVVPYWVSRSPEDFYRLLCRERVTVLNQTPSAFGQLVQAEEALGVSQDLALRTVVFGGEALNLQSLAPWWRRRPQGAEDSPRLVNMYGITETTVHVTYRPLSPADLEGAPGSWIGRAIPDLSVHVLGPGLQPLPAGVPGELHVGGAGLARGYLSRPALTAERFVPDPFSGRAGARLYRSGDLARWRPSGELEYLGRIDHQVKIRGFRIELGEIEAALARHPSVREAVVLKGSGERLLACLVVREEVETAELRRFLGERLPEHMVPSGWVLLDAFPLTTNGKVDRRVLSGMEPGTERAEESREAPRTLAEERLAAIWSDLLGVTGIGARDDFFELGGHSLLATRVVSRVRKAFGVELPLRALFETPKLADLAARIETAGRAAETPIVPVEVERPPLSFGQERLWFLARLEPGSLAYNMPLSLRLRGRLDVEALERSLREVIRRHGTLRTTFDESGGVPFQVVAPEPAFELETDGESPRPFDLGRGPLFRAVLKNVSEDDWRLFVDMHHIVSDGWSMGILVREAAALYAAFSQGLPSPLPEPAVQYTDFAVWQRGRLQGETLETQVRHWRQALAGAPALLELPTDRPRPAVQSYRGASEPAVISGVPMTDVRELAGREGATPFMVVMAAFQELLRRWSGQEDVLVGTPIANRTRSEIEDLIGLFVNTLVMRRPAGPATFRELLAGVRSGALAAYAHQDLPFEKLVEELGVERSLAHSPIFQVMLVLQNAPVTALSLAGLELSPIDLQVETAKFDLLLSLSEDGIGTLDYATDLFDRATARRLLGHLGVLLEAAIADPGARLADLPLLTEAERAELAAWNRTAVEYPDVCLHELIEAQVERTPDAVAVVFEGETLTYRELDEWASALASRLPAELIGISVERSLEMVVGLVAILKAGGAYVPIDPGYPAERVAYMIEDSGVSVLLDAAKITGGRVSRRDAGAPRVSPDQTAYMIYTSGSTGRPKGALNAHRGIVNRILWMQQEYGLTPDDRVLQKTPFSFDVSVWEFFWPLIVGARLVVARPGGHQDPAYLVETIRREEITTLHFVPSMLQVFVEQPGVETCASLRRVMASGEALPADLVKRFFSRLPQGVELHNLYGPTEAAVDVTYHACRPGEERIPIGRPVANTRIHILDADGAQVPAGVAGELFIAGVQVGQGYLHRPDLTAERFIPDQDGARMYRTGDLARWLPNGSIGGIGEIGEIGEIEYLGRIDHQVKIRGFRIELGEIEAALARHPGVREAVVLARDQSLVACVVTAPPSPGAGGGEAGEGGRGGEGLRAYLRASLPEHMVPSAFVFLEAMPVTPNGKADRKALARVIADLGPERRERAVTAPRTAAEEILAGIWRDLLGVEGIGAEDRFFDLGGHSLMATRLVSRVRDAFGVELPLRAVFEAPALGDLAVRIGTERGGPAAPPLRRAPREADPPLSFSQERLWFLDQLDPGSALYNIPAALRLSGGLDVRALERSFQEVVRRHEALRTTFPVRDGQPVQRVAPALVFALPEVDLSALAGETRTAELRRIAAAEAARPFDLWTGPLLRVLALRLDAREHACVLTIHHIVGDAWSFDVLVREVGAFYAADIAFLAGEASPLPEPALQYADFAVWQRGWLRGDALEAEMAWWRRELAGAPTVLDLPTDRPRPAARTQRGGALPVELPAAVPGLLQAVCRREGVTPFMALLASFQALLHRMSGVEDLLVGTPVGGRARTELEGLIGFFVNTLPLRGRPAGEAPFRERLAEARTACLGAFAHPDIPLERLIEDLGVQRSLAHPPLVQVAFALQNAPMGALELPGLTVAPMDLTGSTAKFDLTLYLFEEAGRLHGGLEYSSDLFDRATLLRFAGAFGVLLEAALADPGLRLDDLPVLEESLRHQILAEWNDHRCDFPERGVPGLFEEQADLRPDAVAVVFAGERLTYGELDRRANRLANFLRGLGVGLGTPVAIYLERSLEMVVSTLAVLKAGGAYVPLDTSYPEERLAFMLEDVGAPVLITREEHLGLFPGSGLETVCVDRYGAVLARMSAARPRLEVPSQALAYVIYTSGSTGRPKGVAVPHRAIVRLVRESNYVVLGPDDVVAQASNTSFDAATFEIWGALLNGGRLVGVSKETMLSPAGLAAQIRRDGIGVLFLTTALFNQVSREVPEAFAPMRAVLFGGEQVDPARVRAVLRNGPPERLLHVYGPTESTTFASWHLVESVAEGAATVPIGQPLGNTTLLVLDRSLRPVPPGWSGELYVGGDGLAWGYANRPELTAERFVPDPFAAIGGGGERLYRTGDVVRRRADGAIEFQGRADFQVKIRGFRIELGEVQSALLALPEVLDAAVLAVGAPGDTGDRRLVAYVSPRPGEALREAGVRAALAERLPSFMVPSAVVVLESLPLNPNGKVDRKALARIEPAASGERKESFVAPRTPAEEMLAGVWSELLGVERIGAEDLFFDLGGHSLLATRLVSLVRERFGAELPLRTVFEAPTLAGMAQAIEQARAGAAGEEAPPILPLSPAQRGDRPPLSFAQERLWFLDRMEPGRAFYNVPGAVRLRGSLDVAALGRATGRIAERHEALRTTFAQLDGVPFQVVAPELRLPLPVADLSALPDAEREAEVPRRLRAEAARPFDLARGPLLRVLLLRLDPGEWVLVFNFHHIVSDGWSIDVFVRELAALYGGSPLPGLPVQYADYAVWQRRWLTDEVLAPQIAYWREALAGAPAVLELPTDRPRPAVQTFRGATRPLALSAGLSGELRALSRRQGGTLFMTLLAGYQALLHRYSGQGEVLVGSPIANRGRREIEGLIGLFVNAVALRGRMSDGPSFRELLGRVRAAALGAYAHQDLPFERLVEELQIERSLGRMPLYQAVFALQSAHEAGAPGPAMQGIAVEPLAVDTGTAKLDLLLSLTDAETGLAGGWEYSADLFERATIDRLSGHLARLLEAAAADPERGVAELPLLTAEESVQLLAEWNDTGHSYPEVCLHDLLRGPVERAPDAVAARFEDESLTYRELDARGERLARRLRLLGVGPDRLVGICADEGIDRLVAVLAVFKAGGAYLPLDPAHPAERLAFMMEDAGIAVLLAEEHLLPLLPRNRAVVVLLGERDEAAAPPASFDSGVVPDNLAYVIYTSGSTGRPNGVMVRHRSAVNLILHAIREAGVEPDSRVLQTVSFSFDASVLETWSALASGATLCIGTRESRMSGEALAGLMRHEGITHAVMTPSVLAMLPVDGVPALRSILMGGDRCPVELANRWAPPASGLDRLLNCYGPTETTIYAAAGPVQGTYRREPPIGQPVANLRAYVLDARGQLLPVGVPGELYMGGEGLARGYLARPALTAERFVPDPFGPAGEPEPGARLYRTGDLARRLPGGDLEFLGRVDGQVKIRGLRIETGEVEAVLGSHDAVAECAVLVREGSGGEPVLFACVVPRRKAGEQDLVKELREYLRSRLPDYMVPGTILFLESMPLSPTGKMDRSALRRLDLTETGSERIEARDVIELELVRLWQEVLGVPRIGVRENFFALGGHSLLAVRLMARVQERFGRELPLAVLFQEGTVEEMAARLRRDDAETTASCLVPIQPSGSARPFFCVHPAGGDVLCYAALARHLGPDQPVYGLQSRGLSSDEPPLDEVAGMAALYVDEMRRLQPSGPYRLGGWSLGGVIAFEMARQLAATGEEVELLAMLDSSPAIVDLAEMPDDVALLLDIVAYVANLWNKPDLSASREELEALAPEARLDYVLGLLREADFLPRGVGRDRLRRVLDVYRANGLAVRGYELPAYAGPLTLFKAADGPVGSDGYGWSELAAGGVEVETVPGHHLNLLAEPNVRTLAERLRSRLMDVVPRATSSS